MQDKIRFVAVVGAGASGAAAAAALAAEKSFDRVRVFERRETPGGTWIYDPVPSSDTLPSPGRLAPALDPPLSIPTQLPATSPPITRERWQTTPVYEGLTTNVPAIAMSFSDLPYPYGPFVPHWIPKQDIQDYFTRQRTDTLLALSTTVEDITKLPKERWCLTLRRYDATTKTDRWWQEDFDALVLANGHYSVPFIPHVPGLEQYIQAFPGRVLHSKTYRTTSAFAGKQVLIIGNSASGHDITTALISTARLPVYQSRRSRNRWDRNEPPAGVAWKPVISRYCPTTGSITFTDGTTFGLNDLDNIIYCTGYQPSFPFWNSKANGGSLWDYSCGRLRGNYLHTFFPAHPTLGLIGMPRTLTFRSFEYQAIALARLFARRNSVALPSREHMRAWEDDRTERCRVEHKKFHDVPWEEGQTMDYFQALYEIAGLPTLDGHGKFPPVLDEATRWAVENVRKYPEPDKDDNVIVRGHVVEEEWVLVAEERFRGLQVLP